jgi:hypothetical protein
VVKSAQWKKGSVLVGWGNRKVSLGGMICYAIGKVEGDIGSEEIGGKQFLISGGC